MKSTGYIKSVLDGSELDFDDILSKKSLPLPDTFNYSKVCKPLKTIKDQGSTSMCVAYSLSYVLETLEFLSDNNSNFKLDKNEIYKIRSNKKLDGMQPKEALEYIKNHGYKFDASGVHKILKYGKLRSPIAIKKSLIANGPCLFALPCFDECKQVEFWKGQERCGGHAVCCVGWTDDGFIIENSWGKSWGKDGKTILPWTDVKYLLEAWGLIK